MVFTRLWNYFLDVIFPQVCLSCKIYLQNRDGKLSLLCGKCQKQIEINNCFYCPKCGRRLPDAKKFCHQDVRFILAAATSYQNKVSRELIHILKYEKIKTALQPLTEITGLYINKVFRNPYLNIKNFIIIPIPLHPAKERERGFNQASLIAQAVLQSLEAQSEVGLPRIETGNLARVKNTKSQTKTKNYEERKENITGCFKIKNPEVITGKNVLLVDDIFTSGATMREAVRILKLSGAKKIIGFVIAKA